MKNVQSDYYEIKVNCLCSENYTPAELISRWAANNNKEYGVDRYFRSYIYLFDRFYYYDSWNIQSNNDGTETVTLILKEE